MNLKCCHVIKCGSLSLPNNKKKKLDWVRLEAFANHKLDVAKVMVFFFFMKRWNETNAGYQHFFLFIRLKDRIMLYPRLSVHPSVSIYLSVLAISCVRNSSHSFLWNYLKLATMNLHDVYLCTWVLEFGSLDF